MRLRRYAAIAAALASFAPNVSATLSMKRNTKPNIVVILTDDQDSLLGSMDNMNILQEQMVQQGVTFSKHYGHVSQCCPARATLWTGRHAHNTNITSVINDVPGGAWKHIQMYGYNKNYLPVWMQAAGYKTYYSGKIFNGYNIKNYCDPSCLSGFTKADILADPRTYTYYNSSYIHYDAETGWTKNLRVTGYSTDQIADNVAGYIDEAVQSDEPFFAVAAPVACHVALGAHYPNNRSQWPFPLPKKEYLNLYDNLTIPKSSNFNPVNRSGVAGVWALNQLGYNNVDFLEDFYGMRQGALRSVDDMITTIIQKLNNTGVLDNTYIIFTSDNGYHIGNHRLQPGKLQCFEEDVNIPFIIRGPDVAKNQTWDLVTGHIDIAPTILTLAGVDINPQWKLDGAALSFPLQSQSDYFRNLQARSETSHLEFWGPFRQEGAFGHTGVDFQKNLQIYKALRLQGSGYNLMYSVWCQNGAHELYDMTWDLYQMSNLHPDAPLPDYADTAQGSVSINPNAYWGGQKTLLGRPTWNVIWRLDALVLVLKTCTEDSCREPWKQLHPDGSVSNLMEALSTQYDDFYENTYSVAKVGWKQCFTGLGRRNSSTLYLLENEQPTWLNRTVVRLVRSGAAAQGICTSTLWALAFAWLGLMLVVGC